MVCTRTSAGLLSMYQVYTTWYDVFLLADSCHMKKVKQRLSRDVTPAYYPGAAPQPVDNKVDKSNIQNNGSFYLRPRNIVFDEESTHKYIPEGPAFSSLIVAGFQDMNFESISHHAFDHSDLRIMCLLHSVEPKHTRLVPGCSSGQSPMIRQQNKAIQTKKTPLPLLIDHPPIRKFL